MAKITLDSQQAADLALCIEHACIWYERAAADSAPDDIALPVYRETSMRLRQLQKVIPPGADIEITAFLPRTLRGV